MYCGWMIFVGLYAYTAQSKVPNIVLIVADDLGYNDIGYHGSEILTPALDRLAAEGVTLENYYVQPICSPTRSQLLSGRYQIHTGLQHDVIKPCLPVGLPLEDKTLADKLKEAGYKTHIVGKWHLGYFEEEYLPTRRGFDTFYGLLNGGGDHFTHYRRERSYGDGLDLHDNEQPDNSSFNEYSMNIFTRRAQKIIEEHDKSEPLFLYLPYQAPHGPLQVPEIYAEKYSHITDTRRRTFAAMVSALDEGVLNVTETLKSSDLWDNTLVIFTTDNGGQSLKGGSNFPLRGKKASYFEGGVRAVGFVSGPVIKTGGVVNHQMIHVSDWFPTLINLAGGSLSDTRPDGYDVWESITENTSSPRMEILFNINPKADRKGNSMSLLFDTSVQAALRYGEYKIITGDHGGDFDDWFPEPRSTPDYSRVTNSAVIDSDNTQNVRLFNIAEDPEERVDLSQSRPDLVEIMLERLAMWNTTAVPVNHPPLDSNCNPDLRGGVWGPWRISK